MFSVKIGNTANWGNVLFMYSIALNLEERDTLKSVTIRVFTFATLWCNMISYSKKEAKSDNMQ